MIQICAELPSIKSKIQVQIISKIQVVELVVGYFSVSFIFFNYFLPMSCHVELSNNINFDFKFLLSLF